MQRNSKYVYGEEMALPNEGNFGKFLIENISKHSNRIALINGALYETTFFKELLPNVLSLAVSLHQLGVRKGDVIAICSENRLEVWSVVIGALCVGAVVTPINILYAKDVLFHVMGLSKPQYLFSSVAAYIKHEATFSTLPHLKIITFSVVFDGTILYQDLMKGDIVEEFKVTDSDLKDTAIVAYTSGNSGLPRGVKLSHLNLMTACNLFELNGAEEKYISASLWCSTEGLIQNLIRLNAGTTTAFLPKFDSESFMKTIEEYKVQNILVDTSIVRAIFKSQSKYDLSAVTRLHVAEPIQGFTFEDIKRRFPNIKSIVHGYGMCETTTYVTQAVCKPGTAKPNCIGFVQPTTIIKVIDPTTGDILGPKQPGEIYIKGPLVMKGYVDAVKDEKGMLKKGFFRTGDVGYYDQNRCFYFIDRLSDMINYKGTRISPGEIEAVLQQHSGVEDVCVVKVPQIEAGEVARAFVKKRSNSFVTEAELYNFVANKLPRAKHLHGGVFFTNDIPRSSNGKIFRREWQMPNKINSKI